MTKYMKQKLTELKKISKVTIIVGKYNILIPIIDRSNLQKTNKNIVDLNTKINQYLQNTPSNNSKILILLKDMSNIHHNKSYCPPQNTPYLNLKLLKSYTI